MAKTYFVYIATNRHNTVLYIGMTNDVARRMFEHQNHLTDGFSKKYNIEKLVHFEEFDDVQDAICREKQLKGGSRGRKVSLIVANNPTWDDLLAKAR